jgi:hypothetical protein
MTGNGRLTRAVARVLTIALFLSALVGCSMLRFGYGQLDLYAAWTVDEYFDLDAAQKQEFSKRFDRLHEWHRQEQLPDYSAFLAAARTRTENGLTRQDVLWIIEGIRERYRGIISRSADDAAALLATMTPAQLEALHHQWDRDNRRFARDHRLDENTEEQRRAAAKRAVTRARYWAGNLTDEQELKIAALAGGMPMNHQLRHQDRLRRQGEFMRLMAQRGEPGFPAVLRHWLLNWETGRDPEYQRLWVMWEQKQADYYVAVDRLLAPTQRAAVARRLQNFADDFNYLALRPSKQADAGR